MPVQIKRAATWVGAVCAEFSLRCPDTTDVQVRGGWARLAVMICKYLLAQEVHLLLGFFFCDRLQLRVLKELKKCFITNFFLSAIPDGDTGTLQTKTCHPTSYRKATFTAANTVNITVGEQTSANHWIRNERSIIQCWNINIYDTNVFLLYSVGEVNTFLTFLCFTTYQRSATNDRLRFPLYLHPVPLQSAARTFSKPTLQFWECFRL